MSTNIDNVTDAKVVLNDDGTIAGLLEPKTGKTKFTPSNAVNSKGQTIGFTDANSAIKRNSLRAGAPFGTIRVARGSTLGPDITVATTLDNEQAALSSFTGVKLIYANYDNVNALPITKFKVTASPSHGYGVGGPNGNNAAHNWIQGYFNGAEGVTVPVATLAASGANNLNIPSFVTSDLIKVTSIPRTDSFNGVPWTRPLLRARSLLTPVGQVKLSTANSLVEWNDRANAALNYGLVSAVGKNAGDFVTTTTDTNSVFDIFGGESLPFAYQFFYESKNITVACVGDSITQGSTSIAGVFGFPQQAHSKLQTKVSNLYGNFMNFGASGQQHRDSMSVARSIVLGIKPDYLTMFAQSPNGSGAGTATQAAMNTQWIDTLAIIELCKQNNVTPIVITSPVFSGHTPALLKSMNERVKAIEGYAIVVDAYAVFSPNDTLLYSSDGTHLSTEGYGILADLVTEAIATAYL